MLLVLIQLEEPVVSAVCVSGDRNPAEILRHYPCGNSHVCPEDRFPVCGFRVWKSVSVKAAPAGFILPCRLLTAGVCCLLSYLYQIAHLGDDDEEPEFSSAMPLEEGDTFFFQPRPLKNLVLVDEQENLSPIMSCQVCLVGTQSLERN